ncbi:DUF3560 domain-containing protein [Streptomyces sp. TR1341]|uniref:DUF3560 domain-containing protein n=1 Tax=Streptomyces sp. TR1341 TaxID=2601266 RepID=UPI00138AF83B|nr:DUF3560 domain-containing protein [Streptomyces sp. TR1341]
MAEITIRHTRAEGTLIHGSEPGDGVLEALNPWGFRYARSIGFVYLRGSRDRTADMRRIRGAKAALEEAGHTVTVDIDEAVRRAFEVAENERYERAGARTERFDARADRLQESSDEKWARGRRIAASYQGEPVKIDHYSAGRHMRDLARAKTLFGQSVAEQQEADRCRSRADSAASYEEGRKHPGTTLRRLDRLNAERRHVERQMERVVRTAEGCTEAGNPLDPKLIVDNLAKLDADHHDLCEQIAHWDAHLAEVQAAGVKIWGKGDFAPGDYAQLGDRWYLVLRANAKSLTVPKSVDWKARVYNRDNQTGTSTSTLPYDKVMGRMSGEEMAARLQADDAAE